MFMHKVSSHKTLLSVLRVRHQNKDTHITKEKERGESTVCVCVFSDTLYVQCTSICTLLTCQVRFVSLFLIQ